MHKIVAALIVLVSMVGESAATANVWSDKLAAEFVANFRDLCLTDRPFETILAELEEQGRMQEQRVDGKLIGAQSVHTREVLGGSGKYHLPVYHIGLQPIDKHAGTRQSCTAFTMDGDFAGIIAPFVALLTELQPPPHPAIVRIRKTCVRDCGLSKNAHFWQLAGAPDTAVVLTYDAVLPGTTLRRFVVPE